MNEDTKRIMQSAEASSVVLNELFNEPGFEKWWMEQTLAWRVQLRARVALAIEKVFKTVICILFALFTYTAHADVTWNDQLRIDDIASNTSIFMLNCFSMHYAEGYVGANCLADSFYSAPMYVAAQPAFNTPVIVTAFDVTAVYLVDAPCVLTEEGATLGGDPGTFRAVTCGDDIMNSGFDL